MIGTRSGSSVSGKFIQVMGKACLVDSFAVIHVLLCWRSVYANEEFRCGGSDALIKPSLKLSHKVGLVAIQLPEFGNNLRHLNGVYTGACASWQPQACGFVVSVFSREKKNL